MTVELPGTCPECGYRFEACSHFEDEARVPKPGDFCVCINCTAVLRLTDGLGLRTATLLELSSDECPPDVLKHVRAVTLANASRRRA